MPNIAVRILRFVFLATITVQSFAADPWPKEEPKLDPKLEALAKRMKDRTLAVRLKAIEEVAKLGDEAAPLAKNLCEATMDSSPKMAESALEALAKVRPDLFEPLASLLGGKNPIKQVAALEKLGSKAEPALPILWSHIQKLEASEQTPAAFRTRFLQAYLEAAGKISGPSTEIIEKMKVLITSKKSPAIRNAAIRTLGLLADSKEDLQKQLLPVVAAGLKDPKVRAAAAEAAGHLGAEAKEVLDTLDALKTDKVEEVRFAVVEALSRIEGNPEPIENIDARAKVRARDALEWIAKNQQRDGSWATGMGANRPAIVVTTSFCALALMTEGKKYQAQVDKTAAFVADNLFQDFSPVKLSPELDQSNWKVAIGGFFICEHYAAQKQTNPKLNLTKVKQVIEKLVDESFKRMEGSGGWGHTPRVKNPLGYVELEIVSIWMLATLGSAQKVDVKVPEKSMQKAIQFVEDCCNPGKGDVGYSPRDGQKGFGCPCRTGGTIFAFASIGQREHAVFQKMVDSWRDSVERSDDGHGSVALGFLGSALGAKAVSSDAWNDFKKRFFPRIIANSAIDGSFRHVPGKTVQSFGSADPTLGSTYNTAIYALILQMDHSGLTGLTPPKAKK